MARKRTKEEALERLLEAQQITSKAPAKGRAKMVRDAAFLGAAGLIMLDPLNRLADERIVLPLDMVCIPAYQAYMIQGTPSLQIYVRAGETIIPTGGNVRDVQEALMGAPSDLEPTEVRSNKMERKTKATAYQKRYKANFNKIASKYKLKNGKWKKNGFKSAVKAAHKMAGGKQ